MVKLLRVKSRNRAQAQDGEIRTTAALAVVLTTDTHYTRV